MTIQRLSILGVGLLGGSIGLALKSASSSVRIIGYGHREESLQAALKLGAIDEATTDLARAVADCELIVLCTPVGVFENLLQIIAPALKAGAIVTDVGSTKRSVCRLAEKLLPTGVHFVGSHPMAGSEERGISAARADLYRAALCITTPTQRTDSAALRTVETFWTGLGMRVTRLSPDDHDRLLSDVSHLPHALAAVLVTMQADNALPLAGKGFADSTRIAAGDAGIWRDIFIDNADNLRDSTRRFRQHLDRLQAMLDESKSAELLKWLDSAARRRRQGKDL
jgi:prephenate dehydrogenase